MARGDLTKEFLKEGGVAFTSESRSKLTRVMKSCAYLALFTIVPLNPVEPAPGFISGDDFAQHIARIDEAEALKRAQSARYLEPNGNSDRWAPVPASYTMGLADKLSSRITAAFADDTLIKDKLREHHVDPSEHTYAFGDFKVPGDIMVAIVKGSMETKMDPKVMMAVAEKESAFRPAVKAKRSSAVGLFQFIESTWLETVKTHGSKHGLSNESDAIKVAYSKKRKRTIYSVANPKMRRHILNLRKNPYVATVMAGEYIQAARAKLEARTGKAVAQEDVYLPHFLGPNGAGRLLEASASKPQRAAKSVFPRAARANRSIFRSKSRWITIAQLHTRLRGIVEQRMGKYENVAALSGLTQDNKTLGPGPATPDQPEQPVVLAGLKY